MTSADVPARRSGRRVGNPDTREEILAVARRLFAARGYDRTAIRAVAAEAGVDAALVHHYFGTKEKLFLAAINAPADPEALVRPLLSLGADHLGSGLARVFVTLWDSPQGAAGVALLRSAVADEQIARLLREFLVYRVVGPALTAVGVDDEEVPLRAALLASQLAGLALARYVLRFGALPEASADAVVAAIEPVLQHYVSGPLDGSPL